MCAKKSEMKELLDDNLSINYMWNEVTYFLMLQQFNRPGGRFSSEGQYVNPENDKKL